MDINTVETQEDGSFKVTTDGGDVLFVPDNPGNRHRIEIQEFVDDGGVISPFVAPPATTDAERIALILAVDSGAVVLNKLFELHNRVLVLEGDPVITLPAFLTELEADLP